MTKEPVEQASVPYAKDADGRILIDGDGEIVSLAQDVIGKASQRNSSSRLFIKDGEAFVVKVTVGGKDYPIVSGVGKAASGKMCSIFIRVRAEADENEPPAPEVP